MSEKEYWSVRVFIDLKDRLYEIADENRMDIGEVLNRCVECGLRHKDEWTKVKDLMVKGEKDHNERRN